MRIRSTKPEFWRSERIASVDWDARLVLKGLESYVDDNGVGKDDLALIVADVFPRDLSRNPTGTLQRVSEAITVLADAGLLWRYEVDGTNLLYVSFWESVQRIEKPTRGRNPRPDGTLNYRESDIGASFPEPSRNPTGTLRPGTGEQGNRGTGEQDSLSPDESDDRGTLLPDEWRPNQSHIDKANSLHLDVGEQYRRFRDHADRTQRRQVSWNTAFTNWLRKGAEMAQQRQGRTQSYRPPTRGEENLAYLQRVMNEEQQGITA